MIENQITNDELLDYLRHDLDDERRKEIATRLYKDGALQRRFKEIQRIEALVTENYNFGKVNIQAETEKNIVRYINETVANIITEKEQNILSVQKLIEENEKTNKESAKRSYLFSGVSWAAAIIICVTLIFNLIADVSKNSYSHTPTSNKDIKSASPIVLPEKMQFEELSKEYVPYKSLAWETEDKTDFNDVDEKSTTNVSNPVSHSNENFAKRIEKFDSSELINKFRGNVPQAELKVETDNSERGDLNKDGLIDKKDLDILKAMLNKDSGYKLGLPADLNNDNKVTVSDLAMLAKIVETNEKNN